jgi:hypothetical protein
MLHIIHLSIREHADRQMLMPNALDVCIFMGSRLFKKRVQIDWTGFILS